MQLCATLDLDANLDNAERLMRRAVDLGAELVLVPEFFCLIGGLDKKVAIAEELDGAPPGPILERMQTLARDLATPLVIGSMPTTADQPGRCHNTTVVLDRDGSILETYDKIHLFDVDIPGGATFCESKYVVAGRRVVIAEVAGLRLGLSICYDLRFPELYRELARRGADVLLVPAAFTLHTGKDHWLTLLRARAIENQAFVLAANQGGRHNKNRVSYGKSCIIDPWGAVIAQVSEGDGVAVAELDLAYLRQIRRELPALTHRQLER
ncbi:MAG: hydrolase [Proteobacteria bacterium]|nr:MAG: hydrolase [Pseudomonadota bacterium]PIE18885.1 MAG: hydrolase [Pseudomonadota bacterium]